jgi:beta-lactam-binding protein with PASTA domain
VVVGLDYKTAQIKLRDANLNIRVLATRYDPSFEPGIIIAQTPQGGERVDYSTVIGEVERRRSVALIYPNTLR